MFKSHENTATPTTEMYVIKGGRVLTSTLQGLSGIIPVPFLSDFLKVAITVLDVCEEAIVIEENVKDLQDRVYTLTLVIIDTVPANGDASTELQGRIKDLKSWVPSVISDILYSRQYHRRSE
ncbi:hypothetical protein B0H13DRAFT_2412537, partial [Mycena leptocephala]